MFHNKHREVPEDVQLSHTARGNLMSPLSSEEGNGDSWLELHTLSPRHTDEQSDGHIHLWHHQEMETLATLLWITQCSHSHPVTYRLIKNLNREWFKMLWLVRVNHAVCSHMSYVCVLGGQGTMATSATIGMVTKLSRGRVLRASLM